MTLVAETGVNGQETELATGGKAAEMELTGSAELGNDRCKTV